MLATRRPNQRLHQSHTKEVAAHEAAELASDLEGGCRERPAARLQQKPFGRTGVQRCGARRLMNSLRCLLAVQCDCSNIIIETVAGSLVQLGDEARQEVRI
jgi:hypothetical protein